MSRLILLLLTAGFPAWANLVRVNAASGVLVCPNVALTSGSAVPVDVARIEVKGEAGDTARVLDRYEHVVRFGATADTEALARKIVGDKPKGEIVSGLVMLVLERNLPFDASRVGLSTETSPGAHPFVGKRSIPAVTPGALLGSRWIAGVGDEGAPLGRMNGLIFEIVGVLSGRSPTATVFAPVAVHQQSWIGPTMKEWCGHPPGAEWLRKFQKTIRDKMRFLKNKKTEPANDAVRCLGKFPDQAYSLGRRLGDRPSAADYDRLFAMTGALHDCVAGSGENIPANLTHDDATDSSGGSAPSSH